MKKLGVTNLGGKSADIGGRPMPTKSAKQERFMQAVAHNPAFAKKVGVSQSVGREFTKKDGGEMKKAAKKYAMGGMGNAGGASRGLDRAAAMSGRTMPATGRPTGMKSGGLAAGHKAADGIASKGKTKAKQIKMAKGGKACK